MPSTARDAQPSFRDLNPLLRRALEQLLRPDTTAFSKDGGALAVNLWFRGPNAQVRSHLPVPAGSLRHRTEATLPSIRAKRGGDR